MDVVTVREERARVASARGPGGAPAGCTPFLPSARGQRGRSQGPAAGPADSVQHAEATRGHVPAPGHGPWGHPRLAGTHLPHAGLTCLAGDAPASRGTRLPRGGRTYLAGDAPGFTGDSPASRGTHLPHRGHACLVRDAPGFTGDAPASWGTHLASWGTHLASRGRTCLAGDAPGSVPGPADDERLLREGGPQTPLAPGDHLPPLPFRPSHRDPPGGSGCPRPEPTPRRHTPQLPRVAPSLPFALSLSPGRHAGHTRCQGRWTLLDSPCKGPRRRHAPPLASTGAVKSASRSLTTLPLSLGALTILQGFVFFFQPRLSIV